MRHCISQNERSLSWIQSPDESPSTSPGMDLNVVFWIQCVVSAPCRCWRSELQGLGTEQQHQRDSSGSIMTTLTLHSLRIKIVLLIVSQPIIICDVICTDSFRNNRNIGSLWLDARTLTHTYARVLCVCTNTNIHTHTHIHVCACVRACSHVY